MFDKLIKRFGIDKFYHMIACFLISFFGGVIMIPLTNMFGVMFCGFWSGIGAACAKEYGDKCSPTNKWDWKDIIADVIGIGLALIILAILKLII